MRSLAVLCTSSLAALSLTAGLVAVSTPSQAGQSERSRTPEPPKRATAFGSGGAVTSVDPYATRVGLRVLRAGGNATDAAVATAAALGVTEPFSAGIGGGGYFVHYSAKTGKVRTIDGRETSPKAIRRDAFIDPATEKPYNFSPELVTSGVSVGVPGTLATWQRALDRWGTRDLGQVLRPAARLAERGFTVDDTFRSQVQQNLQRFRAFTSTRPLYGHAPRVGSTFRNPDLAATYDLIADRGTAPFYRGAIAREIVRAVRRPPTTASTTLPVPRGRMVARDLRRYRVLDQKPTHVAYRDLHVYGMAPSSSGGTTVGEALNILERHDLASLPRAQALHLYLEASALAFADRGKYVGDPAKVLVPRQQLLSDEYAAERNCAISPTSTLPKPVAAGDVTAYDGVCGDAV